MTRHVHDYEMVFDEDAANPLDYEMVCSCGDRCRTMQEALDRTQASRGHLPPRMALRDWAAVMFATSGALFLFAACVARWG